MQTLIVGDAMVWSLGLLPAFALLLALVGCVFWIWALVDCIKNPLLNDSERIMWVVMIVFLHFIGALLYRLLAQGKSPTAGPPVK